MISDTTLQVAVEALEHIQQDQEAFWKTWAIERERPSELSLSISNAITELRQLSRLVMPPIDWSKAPEWAQWGAIEPDGNVSWHETEPQVVLFYWFGDGRNERAIGVFIDIPLGVDWRLLKFQRPQEEPA